MTSPKIEVEETNIEELIVLGEDKTIPIYIEYPNGEDTIKAKAHIKPITMKDTQGLNLDPDSNMLEVSKILLRKGLLKQDGTNFSEELIDKLPLGVIKVIGDKIAEISGLGDNTKELKDF